MSGTPDRSSRAGLLQLLREASADEGWEIPLLLRELDNADDFYFDSITQIVMDPWSRNRVTLVGEAGRSPGPAVGGGTSVAMVGSYVLAQELKRAGGTHSTAFPAYEAEMREFVRRSRSIGPTTHEDPDPPGQPGMCGSPHS